MIPVITLLAFVNKVKIQLLFTIFSFRVEAKGDSNIKYLLTINYLLKAIKFTVH